MELRRHRVLGSISIVKGLFCLAVVMSLLAWSNRAEAQCDYVKTYRLNGSGLNIRSQANTQGSIVGSVPEGTCLKVEGKTSGENINGDTTWYKISYGGKTGWVSGYYAQCSTCGGPPPECSAGQTRACYGGSANTRNVGECKDGVQSCSGGKWGSCSGERGPSTEVCDGKDNNCNGSIDENNPGGGSSCSTGQPGGCGTGTQTCENGKLVCKGGTPSPEKCNGKDDNCDGAIDEGNPEGGQTCNTGGTGGCTQGISQCQNGKIVCQPSQGGGNEICDNQDNDCNGQIDDNLTRACYTGPANTNGVGICTGGKQTCNAGQWGPCQGEINPQAQEICGNQKDDNCNGQTDEGCSGAGCQNGQTQPCYTGPANTRDVGYCKSGTQTCVGGQWDACKNEQLPADKEICNNNTDDNCDGQIDENCSGPTGTCEDKDNDGFGVGTTCQGPQDCDDNDPNVHPNAQEVCGNGKDDDCKGGDLPCGKLGLGEEGCTKPSECTTDFCVKLGDVQRCSKPCKINSDCPAGYTCIQGQACWPPKTNGTGTGNATPCKVNAQCASGEFCDRGFCAQGSGGCGCGQMSTPQSPVGPTLLFLLVSLWLIRLRKNPQTR